MAPDRVVEFAEADYLYGTGPLRMRLDHIDRSKPTWYDGENWYGVVGMQITTDGREIGQRQVLVQGRRLPR